MANVHRKTRISNYGSVDDWQMYYLGINMVNMHLM